MFGLSMLTPALLKGVVYVGLVLAVVAGLWYVYHQGQSNGSAAVTVQTQDNTIKTQRKINAAEAAAPHTPSDVSNSLRDGSF